MTTRSFLKRAGYGCSLLLAAIAGSGLVAPAQARAGEKPTAQAGSLDKSWEGWLGRKILPEKEAAGMMRGFLEQQLQPLPLPQTREAWLGRRDALRREVLGVLGIDGLVPPSGGTSDEGRGTGEGKRGGNLALQSKGVLRREGYRIQEIAFERNTGTAVPAIVYVAERISGGFLES